MNRIFVTGTGMISSIGQTTDECWNNLLHGRNGQQEATRFPPDRYGSAPVCRAAIPEADSFSSEHPFLDDASRLLFHAVDEAVQNRTDLSNAMIYLATTLGGMDMGTRFYRDYTQNGITRENMGLLRDYVPFMQGKHLCRRNHFTQPPLVICNACASGTNAIGLACLALQTGLTDKAVVAGYDIISEFVFGGFNVLRLISRTGCRPFDINRRGLVLGEAAAALVLETESSIQQSNQTPLAEISGYAASCDAYHVTQPHPDGLGAEMVMRACLENASITPEEVSCLNAHGTGTPHNDIMEAKAAARLFKNNPDIYITSNKGSVGHTLGAAGAVEAVFSIRMLRDGTVPPTLGLMDPIPELSSIRISNRAQPNPMRHILSTSYGFGGTNACLAFSKV